MVTKLDRLARALPDARAIADELTTRQVSLNLGGSVYDPNDANGRLLFNVLTMFAEFESDLIRLRTREGMKVAKAKGRLRGQQPKLNRRQEARLASLIDSGEYTPPRSPGSSEWAAPPSTASSKCNAMPLAAPPPSAPRQPKLRPGRGVSHLTPTRYTPG